MQVAALRWVVHGAANAVAKPFVARCGAVGLGGLKASAARSSAVVRQLYTVKLVRYT